MISFIVGEQPSNHLLVVTVCFKESLFLWILKSKLLEQQIVKFGRSHSQLLIWYIVKARLLLLFPAKHRLE